MPEQILYESTNRDLTLEQLLRIKNIDPNIKGPFTDRVSFTDAIIQGQAPDTGLFVPARFPEITLEEIASLKGKPFSDAAYLVFRKFLTEEEISNADLRKLVDETYNFEYPLVHLNDRNYLLMHTMSPTGDFKNTGARANSRFLSYTRPAGMNFIRITSTSGDTGGAVGLADYNVPGLISIILYPKGHISKVQEDIIRKIGGNVIAIAVENVMFSECQDGMAKPALADNELRRELAIKYNLGLTSGNSINWGRVMPQIVHYVYAYAQMAEPVGEPVIFSTPLGNMGHGLAGEMARRMDLPVFSVWPTNENDPFPRYMESGVYRPLADEEQNKECKSNSMIVKNPSNLARLFYFFGGQADKDGNVNKEPRLDKIKEHIYSTRVSMQQEDDTIKFIYNTFGVIIDPHGACGVKGLIRYLHQEKIPSNILTITQITANPYKYKDHIKSLIGVEPEKPEAYKWFDDRKLTGITMPFGYKNFRDLILAIAREKSSTE
jgi:threonine synthase